VDQVACVSRGRPPVIVLRQRAAMISVAIVAT
jgi:hypothetical protein